MTDLPSTGDIVDYPYLWSWQKKRGETEGRKDRPCCTALVIPLKNGQHRIYLLPITTKPPEEDQAAVLIPSTEVRRAGLSNDRQQWVVLYEWNREILERSFYIYDTKNLHSFSRKFTDIILRELKPLLLSKSLVTVSRE